MTVKFAVLGDSIAYGQGASTLSDTAGSRLAAELTESGIPTTLHVFAVPGSRSDALAAQVIRARAWGAQLALIIIGANDLTHFVPPHVAATQLGDAVRELRRADVQVVVAPAPDLSVLPWIPAQVRVFVQAGSAALRQAQARAALSEGARVATIEGSLATGFAADPTLFSADRFHPSSDGYAVIAAALSPAIRAAAADVLDRAG
jgi:lysophospholipase L1-like esterase